ncbi:MAG: tetratricopeptide repeat protein [Methyloprofundus sp.]|nr:tetratricopeptide repeat protein [Methyloprofundus sp.]
MRLFLVLVLALWQSFSTSFAQAYTNNYATPLEMKMLPKLCQVRFQYGHEAPEFAKWKKILGPEYIHVHHYCGGLIDMFQANANSRHRKGNLESAKADFNYVLRNTQNPKFILLPDLYYRLALVSKGQGNIGEAIGYAEKSINAKRNYLNPYILLADIYIKAGKKSSAKKVLLQAKKYHPNSKRLKRRLQKV